MFLITSLITIHSLRGYGSPRHPKGESGQVQEDAFELMYAEVLSGGQRMCPPFL